ncbi:MAG: aminomethyl-transferring glycine dehydrogenase subunit GcvPA [Caldisericaceae bacterium]
MRYIPNTQKQKEQMLKEIGVSSFEELIKNIPDAIRVRGELAIPSSLTESELFQKLNDISKKNLDFGSLKPLVGAGSYKHYIPEVVRTVTANANFYTAYTPYQPELSQGTLQNMFEVQTHLSRLTGMEVIVPSMYDGASALAESVLMAMRLTHKNKIIVSSSLHPHYIETIKAYTEPHNLEIRFANVKGMLTDLDEIESFLDNNTAAVIVQSPNFFGGIEDVRTIASLSKKFGALAIQLVVESLSLGILKNPQELSVDIVAGEAQSFGMDLNLGGPYNGFIGTNKEFMRQLPGRIAGETTDVDGKRAFVMTLRSREQDIRREKATSNICSNHSLNLFAINAYLSLYGRNGIFELASLNTRLAHYLREKLLETGKFSGEDYPFFNEFALKTTLDFDYIEHQLLDNGYLPPLKIGNLLEDFQPYLLFAATEILSEDDIDKIARILSR